MAVQTPLICLRACGYNTFTTKELRIEALKKACLKHGTGHVLDRLENVKNLQSKPGVVAILEHDIRHIISIYAVDQEVRDYYGDPKFPVTNTTIEDSVDKLQKLNSAFDEFLIRDGSIDTPVQIAIRKFQQLTLEPSLALAMTREKHIKHETRKKALLAELDRVRREIMAGNDADWEGLETSLAEFM
jgi:hypothetical protein